MSTATATATATTTSSSTTTLDYLELCRLCLVKERANVPIFEDEGDVRQIFLKIAACLPVKVSRDDKLPKKICDDCVYKVELFYQFWNTTANAEKQLLEWLGDVGGLEDKEFDVLDTNVMKQEGRDNRLDGSVMQISGHQNNMEIGIIDNMSIIQMPDGSEQFTAVPMDASTTIQVVGSSTQVTHDQSQVAHIEEVESEIEDNSDDGCDNEEGLPVKEETEEEQASRAMETQFVTISGDQAGPSGLQQQKMKETQRNADDPKTQIADSKMRHEPLTDLLEVSKEEPDIKEEPSIEMSEFEPIDDDSVEFEEVSIDGTAAIDPLNNDTPKEEQEEMFFAKNIQFDQHIQNVHIQPSNVDKSSQFLGYKKDKYGVYICNYCCFESHTLSSMKFHLSRQHKNKPTESEEESDYETEAYEIPNQNSELTNEDDKSNKDEIKEPKRKPYRPRVRLSKIPEDNSTEKKDKQPQGSDGDDEIGADGFPKPRSTTFRCSFCDYTHIQRNRMIDHLDNEHGDDWKAAVARRQEEVRLFTGKENSNILACLYCEFAATTRSTLAAHTRRKHNGYIQIYQLNRPRGRVAKPKVNMHCDQCDFVTDCKHKMAMHVGRKHTTELNFPCHYCGKRFKVKVDLSAHIKMQHEQTPQVCHVCGKVLGSANALHIHQKREHFLPEFQCHLCRRRVVSEENLREHIERQHENAPKYQCELCGKVFGQPSKLKQHMRCHTGERPHSCNLCGKAFARRSVFRQHMLIHTGKRPYVCDICGKSFTQKPGLICHRKSHPGEKPPLPVVFIDDILTEFVEKSQKQEEEVIEEQVDYEYMME